MKECFVYNAELIRCVDGDTVDAWIDLGFNIKIKKRIRLMGVDTWESRTRDLEEKKKGLEAKAYTKKFCEMDVKELEQILGPLPYKSRKQVAL